MDEAFLGRAKCNLNLADFAQISSPIPIAEREYSIPFDRQYILRMMVRSPDSDGFRIPAELDWLKDTILELDALQKEHDLPNQFVYITVRHGVVTSQTDDIWHVDGFSMRVKHWPEQNYLWTDHNPTEYAHQSFPLPESFDPFRHHIHWYFDERVKRENVRRCREKTIELFDPYFIHRRPKDTVGQVRTFWRISFIPIEIEDGQCQQNPLLPVKTYANKDMRDTLVHYMDP